MNKTLRRLAFLGFLTLSASAPRAIESGPYSMEILVGGTPAREYFARGTTYVEARRQHDYAIRLSNNTCERVAVALAVDGLNSIDARHTSAPAARKWILGPWESVTLEGWQTSGATARRFVFTTEKQSYGAWLGRTDDLGIVNAVFFREKQPVWRTEREIDDRSSREQRLERAEAPRQDSGQASRQGAAGAPRQDSGQAPRSDSAQAPASAPRPGSGQAPSRDSASSGIAEKKEALGDNAATGIGDELSHPVRSVAFEHEPNSAASLRIRYEYRDALVRLGVVPPPRRDREDALARRERARGFDNEGFAPDPYRRPR